jgi:5'-3' exonuclease
MGKLQKQLEFFIAKKVSTDPLWKHTEVILSGQHNSDKYLLT